MWDGLSTAVSGLESLEQTCPSPHDVKALGSVQLLAVRRPEQGESEGPAIKVGKSRGLQPRLLHPAKPSFRPEGAIKCFPDKRKVKKFITCKPLLDEMLKGLTEEKEDRNSRQH